MDVDQLADTELTGYELDVASRPMIRGAAGADDLENYIEEEIVISSEGQASDISPAIRCPATNGRSRPRAGAKENMAIDFSRPEPSRRDKINAAVAEGWTFSAWMTTTTSVRSSWLSGGRRPRRPRCGDGFR